MPTHAVIVTLSPRDYDAVLFDLDGVLTPTAAVHAAAWKKLFDDFLRKRAAGTGDPFVPFDIDTDYRRYVDGKLRYDGVTSFLRSRGVDLPFGSPQDPPEPQTVQALGEVKDRYFLEQLKQHGIAAYEDSVAFVRTLRSLKIRTTVVSFSNNCAAVLEAAGIADLKAEPSCAVVVEDAIAGVAAGRAGGFGIVVGVDRGGQAHAPREAGADDVVSSLAQVRVAVEPPSTWSLVYDNFDPPGARASARPSAPWAAWVLARSDRERAMRYFAEALQSDVSDIQQGTTAEGVHLGAMAGTVDLVQRVSTGIEVTGDVLRLNPRLPEGLSRLDLRIRYRGHTLDLRLTRGSLTVRGREAGPAPIRMALRDEVFEFAGGSTRVFPLDRDGTGEGEEPK